MPTKKIKKQEKKHTPTIRLDEWEEAVAGEFYKDYNDCINKTDKDTLRKLHYWQNYKTTTWIDKLYKKFQVWRLKNKVDHYQKKCIK